MSDTPGFGFTPSYRRPVAKVVGNHQEHEEPRRKDGPYAEQSTLEDTDEQDRHRDEL
jgi:hypothetical protein